MLSSWLMQYLVKGLWVECFWLAMAPLVFVALTVGGFGKGSLL